MAVVRGRCAVCLGALRGCMSSTILCRRFFFQMCLFLVGVAIVRLPASTAPALGVGLVGQSHRLGDIVRGRVSLRRPLARGPIGLFRPPGAFPSLAPQPIGAKVIRKNIRSRIDFSAPSIYVQEYGEALGPFRWISIGSR